MWSSGAAGDCIVLDQDEMQSHPWPTNLWVVVCGLGGRVGKVGQARVAENLFEADRWQQQVCP